MPSIAASMGNEDICVSMFSAESRGKHNRLTPTDAPRAQLLGLIRGFGAGARNEIPDGGACPVY